MISAESFIEAARARGFTRYIGVPCSYLTPFINYVINDDRLSYISSSNEGDAVATAAGLAAGGERSVAMMQNSGLGNAINPLTSLTHVFDIPLLIIVTHRGKPGCKDEPQHDLMGKITTDLFDLMEIPWEPFPVKEQDIETTLNRVTQVLDHRQKPCALVMNKDTVAPHPLKSESIPSRTKTECQRNSFAGKPGNPVSREQALREIIRYTPVENSIVIATTGYTGRELFAIDDRRNQIYMVGSMGCASSFALGLSLARPALQTIIIDGDGAGLMRMGNFATIGSYGQNNLSHILLDNGVHDSTGAQATVSNNVNFADVAAACGYGLAISGNDLATIKEILTCKNTDGARFAHLKIKPGAIDDLPRPDLPPRAVLRRLTTHFNINFRP